MPNFYEIDELVLDTRYVRAIDGTIFPAVAPTNGATVVVRDAGTTDPRTVYDAPNPGANVIPQPLHTTNGRIEGYIAGETPIDLIVNGGVEPVGYVQRWSPPQAGAGGSGGGLLDGQVDLADHPRIDPELDDSGRLERAVDRLDLVAGGELLVPFGLYSCSQLPAQLMGAIDVVIRGVGGRGDGGATAAWIDYTGDDVRGWDLRGSIGVRLLDVMLTYSNPAFTGTFIDFGHSSGTSPANRDSNFSSIDRSTVMGWGGARGASELISFDSSHSHEVGEVLLKDAVRAIVGRKDVNHYSNAITLRAVHTANTDQAPIQNAGAGWVAINPVAEPLVDGSAGWYSSEFKATGLVVDGGWFGDSNGTGTWIAYDGNGLQVRGPYIASCDKAITFGASSFACSVEGVTFDSVTTAFALQANCSGMRLWPNAYQNVTNRITCPDTPANSILPTNAAGVILSGLWKATAIEADTYLSAYANTANQATLGRTGPGVAGPGLALGTNLDVNIYKVAADILGTDDTLRIGANLAQHLDVVPVFAGGVATALRWGDGTGWRLDFGPSSGTRKFSLLDSGVLEWGGGAQLSSPVTGALQMSGPLTLGGLLNLGGFKATNGADPTAATDLATKQYVDTIATGLQQHAAVRAASVVNQALGTQGSRTIDGVVCASGDRVLLKAQTTASQNGIYVVNADFSLSRAADGAQGSLKAGATVWVNEGATNQDTAWTLLTDDPITVGTTAQTWTQSNALGQVVAGAGLTKTGAQLDIGAGANIQVNADTIQVAASPAFTGTPTAPTPTAGDSSLKLATTAFVAGAWTAFPYNTTDWQDAGGSDQVVQYRVNGNGDVKLRGSAVSKTGRTITFGLPGVGTTIGTLPAGSRPPKFLTVIAYANDGGAGGIGRTTVAVGIDSSGVMAVLGDLTGRAPVRTSPFAVVFDGTPPFSTLA